MERRRARGERTQDVRVLFEQRRVFDGDDVSMSGDLRRREVREVERFRGPSEGDERVQERI